MRNSILGGVFISAVLLLAGCGGDSGPNADADVSITGVKTVAIHDMATGEQLALHTVESVSPNTTRLLTVQHPGNDAAWGTADDMQTARTTCTYAAAGKAIDKRLQQMEMFWPEQLDGVSASACLLVRPDVSRVDVVVEGGMRSAGEIDAFLGLTASPTGQTLLNLLGWSSFTMTGVVPREFRFMAQDGGIRACSPDCAYLGYAIPADAPCSVNCSGIDEVVYGPYEDLDITSDYPLYAGTQLFPSYSRRDGVLTRLSYSRDLGNPERHVEGYESYLYGLNGDLAATEHFVVSDGPRMTRRDVMQHNPDGVRRIRYVAAGEDGVWRTSDDVIGSVATLHENEGRVERIETCSAAGADGIWQTSDDGCQLLTFSY